MKKSRKYAEAFAKLGLASFVIFLILIITVFISLSLVECSKENPTGNEEISVCTGGGIYDENGKMNIFGNFIEKGSLVAFLSFILFFSVTLVLFLFSKSQEKIEEAKKNFDRKKVKGEEERLRNLKKEAMERETAKDYNSAIRIWEELGEIKEAARLRTLKAKQSSVKVAQKVVHGDEVTKTEIKDSVLNRSNVGSGGGSSKAEELREAKSLLDEGLINEDDYEKMKKEILGK